MKSTPYILFDGNCAEAMAFYQQCVGGELSITKVGDSPMKAMMPENLQERTLNARLVHGAVDISASDWLLLSRERVQGNTVCIYLSEGNKDELTTIFEALSEGAHTVDALQVMPFGIYGALTDKFGVRWMFQGNA
jgi:PhnB protein